jgi:hypothetical protein
MKAMLQCASVAKRRRPCTLGFVACLGLGTTQAATFSVTLAPEHAREPLNGRLLLLLSVDPKEEPRFQIADGTKSQQVFGVDAKSWSGSEPLVFDSEVLGYPRLSLADVPAGTYRVQALLHKYETFRRKDGHVVQLPMDRGEGQVWNKAPGNLYSTAREITFDPADQTPLGLVLDQIIPPINRPPLPSGCGTSAFRAGCFQSSGAVPCIWALTCCCRKAGPSIPKLAIRS